METSSEQTPNDNPPDERPKTEGFNKLMESPDVSRAILEAVRAWQKHIEIEGEIKRGAGWRFLALATTLFIGIILSVSILTWFDRISAEATGFLLGAIVTGAIAVIRDITGGSR